MTWLHETWWWVLALFLAVWALLFGIRRDAAGAVGFPSTVTLPSNRGAWVTRSAVRWSRGITLALLGLALLRPQTIRSERVVRSEGIDIVLVMDTSQSMQARDLDGLKPFPMRRDRLQVAKDVVARFIRERAGDRIGLVVFGSTAFTQAPLTLDHRILEQMLEQIQLGVAGTTTAIGDGLGIALKRLEDSVSKSKVVVLLTDGQNNAGALDPRAVATMAKTLGVRIYTIGAGSRAPAGGIDDVRQRGQSADEIDEELLRFIGEQTGGAYFRAESAGALAAIYTQIDRLEKTEREEKRYIDAEDHYPSFLVAGLVLLMLEILLLNTRLRVLP